MLPREELLKGVENRDIVAHVIDRAEQAIKTWEIVLTDFLSPPELIEIHQIFSRLTEVQLIAWGGIRRQKDNGWRSLVPKFL